MAAFIVVMLGRAVPVDAQAGNTLVVNPPSGPHDAAFTATYYAPAGCTVGIVVQFWFDDAVDAYGADPLDADCTASVTAAPATGFPPGSYPVRAQWCTLVCLSAFASYRIPAPATTTTTTTIVPQALPPMPVTTTTVTTVVTTTTTTTIPTLPVGLDEAAENDPGLVAALAAATPGPGDIDTAPAVIVTNLLLALLLLLLFGTTSAVFNSTLDANRDRIDAWAGRMRRRLRALPTGWWQGTVGRLPAARWAVILLLTALVYGFLSPGFGFDAAGLLLILGLIAGLGALTSVSEGGAAWWAKERLGLDAAVTVHAGGLLAALGCVAFTRAVGFEPAVMYGFVASTAMLTPVMLDRVQNGKAALYPALWLLGAAIAAWTGLGMVRSAGWDGAAGSLLENVLAIVFVGGIEGTLYNLLPLTFMDGRAVVEWSRPVWAGAFFVTAFLFWQLLINPDTGYLDAFAEAGVRIALGIAAGYAVITAATWGWFRWRSA